MYLGSSFKRFVDISIRVRPLLANTEKDYVIKEIPMVVADQSKSAASRTYRDALIHSDYFTIAANAEGEKEVTAAIDSGQACLG